MELSIGLAIWVFFGIASSMIASSRGRSGDNQGGGEGLPILWSGVAGKD